ncbi:CLUMA_CG006109, isoform A [Clunio marinus]|uniref:CLUMA_CG006109, isoform A n=1 Tax=Clunio marinus TaxID=568069 RepID=A0A1J1HWQ8_9DIPT|nr:CLUMA_CG006109, isoform A [Clunio marinus]
MEAILAIGICKNETITGKVETSCHVMSSDNHVYNRSNENMPWHNKESLNTTMISVSSDYSLRKIYIALKDDLARVWLLLYDLYLRTFARRKPELLPLKDKLFKESEMLCKFRNE